MSHSLDAIDSPEALRTLSLEELGALAQACRHYLTETLNAVGGHYAASLGVTELTIALHYVLATPEDILIWDVGHQAYIHKMLTGRKSRLATIKRKEGLAPFPLRAESEYDAFGVGHASTALSAALGFSLADRLNGRQRQVVAVLGDGGLTGGMSFEALNHAGAVAADLLVILNDNAMSISENVGALNRTRAAGFFQSLGFDYSGPIDGHDLPLLISVLRALTQTTGPRVLHVITQKGKGCALAEQDPVGYHHVAANFKSPQPGPSAKTYSNVFGQWLLDTAAQCPDLVAITPAMAEGSDLVAFAKRFPERYIDVGIAESHALTLAAGLACAGKKPVVAIYSSFLQRAYDQLIHDLALQNLNVVLAVDRAGLVGPDGPTHAGSFDGSYLACIPNLMVMAPGSREECEAMLDFAYAHEGPAVVRYPRGAAPLSGYAVAPVELGRAQVIKLGNRMAILALGSMVEVAMEVGLKLNATVVNMRFIKPIDQDLVLRLAKEYKWLVTLEENALIGGLGSQVACVLAQHGLDCTLYQLGLPDTFLPHASREELLSACGLSSEQVCKTLELYCGLV